MNLSRPTPTLLNASGACGLTRIDGIHLAVRSGNTLLPTIMQKEQKDNYGAIAKHHHHHLEEEDIEDDMIIIGDEYSSPIKFSPDSSLAPTEDDSSYSICLNTTLPTSDESAIAIDHHHHQHQTTTSLSSSVIIKRNSTNADARLAMASNFSAAYNTFNISLALALMRSSHLPNASSDITSCSSAVIGGMIVGQLMVGVLGDWLGRHMAMAVVMCVQVGSALMSAFSGLGEPSIIYTELAIWRFLLGFGCGGVYPLSATITAESSSQKEDRPRLLAKMISMQGVAYLVAPVIAYTLVLVFGEGSDLAWRLLLGIGSLPGLLLIIIRLYRKRNVPNNMQQTATKKKKHVRLQPKSLLEQIQNEDKLGRKLIGTAGCWLLFDILFYGNALFQPKVLQSAFGQSETELDLIRDTIIIGLLALPGKKRKSLLQNSRSRKCILLYIYLHI